MADGSNSCIMTYVWYRTLPPRTTDRSPCSVVSHGTVFWMCGNTRREHGHAHYGDTAADWVDRPEYDFVPNVLPPAPDTPGPFE